MIKRILDFNPVILALVVIDFFVNGALATIAPFFAVYVTEQIQGGSVSVVGFATAAFWVVKSALQLPVARLLDKTKGERDEFWAFFCGYFVAGFVPLIYYFASEPWHVYVAQAMFGLAMAWATPAWYSIFTKHLDKLKVGFEWSLFSVFSLGLSSTLASAFGGVIIERFGFGSIFIMASALIFASSFGIFSIREQIVRAPREAAKAMPEHKHHRPY